MTARAKAAYPRRSVIDRAITAAKDAGMKIGGFEVDPDGTVRILTERTLPAADDAYAKWAAKRARG
ncbi:hypothetical protein SFC76_03165 [Sphingomonas sp. CD22]|uniref:hypothetical protein n=1 Tax=Sphingomonas sp. CD22 TaxID=3100214 RepID=UPI002ADF15EB|nr:hypothetical protein [Sphingomonas sp. CD22]MEA1083249.1 hypothetical protein [Sphingomonas sp. CD22]